jgi:hypothetical protein
MKTVLNLGQWEPLLAYGLTSLAGLVVFGTVWSGSPVTGQQPPDTGLKPQPAVQDNAVVPEKASRTPAQQKIDSRLLYEIYRRRGEAAAKNVPPAGSGVKIDAKGRALVDVRVDVSAMMQKKISGLGSTIVSSSVEYRSIVAWIPLLKLEQLAGDPAVRAITPPSEATTKRPLR